MKATYDKTSTGKWLTCEQLATFVLRQLLFKILDIIPVTIHKLLRGREEGRERGGKGDRGEGETREGREEGRDRGVEGGRREEGWERGGEGGREGGRVGVERKGGEEGGREGGWGWRGREERRERMEGGEEERKGGRDEWWEGGEEGRERGREDDTQVRRSSG